MNKAAQSDKRSYLLIVVLVFLFLASIAITLFIKFQSFGKKGFPDFPAAVKTVTVEESSIASVYKTVGTLESDTQADIRPEAMGLVEKVLFSEGQVVQQGQALFKIKADKQVADLAVSEAQQQQAFSAISSAQSDYQARLAQERQAKASEQLAQSELKRYSQLYEKEFISAQDLEQKKTAALSALSNAQTAHAMVIEAQSKIQQAKALRAGAEATQSRFQASLKETIVRAPFSGTMSRRYANIGDYVTFANKMAVITSGSQFKVSFGLPEKYLHEVRIGGQVSIRSEASPEKVLAAQVVFIDPVVNTETRTLLVKALVPHVKGVFQPGQYVATELILGQKNKVVVLPEEALVPQGERYFVYTVKQGHTEQDRQDKLRAYFQPVEVGIREAGRVEITRGLTPGQLVVVSGTQNIRQDGAWVNNAPPSNE
jgi:membrane fusion protein, multidrug efflux system